MKYPTPTNTEMATARCLQRKNRQNTHAAETDLRCHSCGGPDGWRQTGNDGYFCACPRCRAKMGKPADYEPTAADIYYHSPSDDTPTPQCDECRNHSDTVTPYFVAPPEHRCPDGEASARDLCTNCATTMECEGFYITENYDLVG